MTVFDTLNNKVKGNFSQTLQDAKKNGEAVFSCRNIDCRECPFRVKIGGCHLVEARKSRTLEEWADFLFSEIEEDV